MNASFPPGLRRLSRRPRMLLTAGVAVLLLLAAFWVLRPGTASEAQRVSGVGYVNWSQVQAAFLQPQLEEPLTELTQLQEKLQDEFDEQSKEMSDAEKQDLFDQYQAQLDEKLKEVQELEAGYTEQALQAVSEQAEKQGVELVLQQSAVLQGGVDLTPGVLQALGIQE